jgi:hypothetical protein
MRDVVARVRRALRRAREYVPRSVEAVAGIEQALDEHVVGAPKISTLKKLRVSANARPSVPSLVRRSRIR